MRFGAKLLLAVSCVALASSAAFSGTGTTLPQIGGFEGTLPAYWTMGSQPSGATLSWATDQSRSMGHSLKIVKASTTTDSAAWVSENMCDIWSPQHLKNVDILLGAYVMTQNVNTSPSTIDQMWYLEYDFYDSAGVSIGTVQLPIDQSVASSSGWVADTNNPGTVILPKDSWTTIVKFVAGKNATGTVWAGDFVFYGRAGAWAGQDWNTSVGVPTGWYYWLPPIGGNDGRLDAGFENTIVTNEAAHSGSNSLKYNLPFGRRSQDAFVGFKRLPFADLGTGGPVQDGDVLRIKVWIKASNLVPDSAAKYPGTWSVGLTPLFFNGVGNNSGYNVLWAHDYTFAFPAVTQFDWTQYALDVPVPSGMSANALEVRLHVYSQFTGTVYFDDITVEKVSSTTLAAIAGFEGTMPAYWNIASQPSGATVNWATDQSRSMGHSLKIAKPTTTADSAAWISSNMCDIWSPQHLKNVDILLGAYVMTQNVNTGPSSPDQMWYLEYDFYDSAGASIGSIQLPIDQSVASSSGWVADTNNPGTVILPKDSWTTIAKFVAGKNATGTVWAGDFVFYGRAGAWAGQDWNTSVGVPTGWYYWLPPIGGNDGRLDAGFENTIVTNEAAHSGSYSLKYNLPFGRRSQDAFVGIRRELYADLGAGATIKDGDTLQVGVWIKARNLVPDSAAKYPGTWSVGITPLFFDGIGNNFGYNPLWAHDYTFAFPADTAFNWTYFTQNVQVPPALGATALELRLHVYSQFTGTVYFDDLSVTDLGSPPTGVVEQKGNLPKVYALMQNYPNPFNPTTNIRYALPHQGYVSLVIYNMLGQRIRSLVNDFRPAGDFMVTWDGRDDAGRGVSTGVYFYQMRAGENVFAKKMLLLK